MARKIICLFAIVLLTACRPSAEEREYIPLCFQPVKLALGQEEDKVVKMLEELPQQEAPVGEMARGFKFYKMPLHWQVEGKMVDMEITAGFKDKRLVTFSAVFPADAAETVKKQHAGCIEKMEVVEQDNELGVLYQKGSERMTESFMFPGKAKAADSMQVVYSAYYDHSK